MWPKNDKQHDVSKSYGRIMTKLGGWLSSSQEQVNSIVGVGPEPDTAYRWETKHKLFSLAEVCALPNAVLVVTSTCAMNITAMPCYDIYQSHSSADFGAGWLTTFQKPKRLKKTAMPRRTISPAR